MMHELTEVRKLIIGGTAAYRLDLSPWRPVTGPFTLQTPYGESPAITLLKTDPGQNLVAFCSRHGNKTLKRSAAFLNHRATIWAAKMLGVETIFSWNGVGAIDESLSVGDLVVPADLIDFTRTRVITFGHPDLRPDRPGRTDVKVSVKIGDIVQPVEYRLLSLPLYMVNFADGLIE